MQEAVQIFVQTIVRKDVKEVVHLLADMDVVKVVLMIAP